MSSRREALALALPDPEAPVAQRVLLFRLLMATGHELRTRMDRALASSGLTTQQAMVLQYLEGESVEPTLTQFAARLGMTHQNIKQIVAVLARKGLVRIVIDRTDRRVRRLRLTARHRRLWAQRGADDHASVVDWTAVLSDEQVRVGVQLLDRLHESLSASR
jgi:DNA-binding MarR family transcriptional regulator